MAVGGAGGLMGADFSIFSSPQIRQNPEHGAPGGDYGSGSGSNGISSGGGGGAVTAMVTDTLHGRDGDASDGMRSPGESSLWKRRAGDEAATSQASLATPSSEELLFASPSPSKRRSPLRYSPRSAPCRPRGGDRFIPNRAAMDLAVARYHLVDEPRLQHHQQWQQPQRALFTPPPQQQQQQSQQQSPSAAPSPVVSPLKENYKKKLAESFLSPSPGKSPSRKVKCVGSGGTGGGGGQGSFCASAAVGGGEGDCEDGGGAGEGSPVGGKIFAFYSSDPGGGSSSNLLAERATNLPIMGPVLLPESPSSAPARKLRQISLASERILDAPEIVDDYYLNLLDWSSQNQIAVALGTTVYLWSASTGDIHQLVHADGPDDYVTSVAWAKDGRHLAVGLNSSELQIWDASRLRQVRRLQGHRARVGSLAWNGHMLSSGSRDSSILNHDVRMREHVVSTLRAHEQEVCGLKWSRSGQHLASGGNDNLLLIWDNAAISSSSFSSSYSSSSSFSPFSSHSSFRSSLSSSLSSLSGSPLPPLLRASASFPPFSDSATTSPLSTSSLIASLTASLSSAPLPSASSLASLLAASPSSFSSPFASPHSSLSFAPSVLASSPSHGTAAAAAAAAAADADGGSAADSFLPLLASSSSPPPPSLSSSPSTSSSASHAASAPFPSARTHRPSSNRGTPGPLVLEVLSRTRAPFPSARTHRPSSNRVRYLHRLTAHQAAVKALAWCPFQSHLLASGGGTADRCIKFWNTQTGTMLHSLDTHSQVCALEWSRHEREILSSHGYSLNQLCLWRYPTMAKLAEFTGHTARVLHLAQSPDGYSVVSAAADETLRFWNAFGDPDGDKRKGGKGGGRGCERRVGGGGGGGAAAYDDDGVPSARCSLLRSHIR